MSSSSRPDPAQSVPGLDPVETDRVLNQTFQKYSSSTIKRNGKGVAIAWFRNDLRVLDNEALYKAWVSSQKLLPVYCVDPRLFGSTYHFGFPKTGALRAQFLVESLDDLRRNLTKRGLNLLVLHGKPEEVMPALAETYGAHTVYAQKETCSEEVHVERLVSKGLRVVANNPKLQLVWGTTMYHVDDLPFDASSLPDVYTQFRKSVEAKCTVRGCIRMPASMGPTPTVEDWGCVPSLDQFGLQHQNDLLSVYKKTRNGMLGPDYSTKFSPWLASGSLSPRLIYEEVRLYEQERQANESTYWVLFELIWRDYFRFLSIKYGNSLFHSGGPRKLENRWSQEKTLFESWRDGWTGYPLIDANMKELSTTGFMSNRGRQIVCSFLVRDMGIDWRMGAEWFETCLLDYDPCSNYGVGNDPREDRYFSIPKQAQNYDPEGEYVAYWLPQLKSLPKEKRHFPGMAYIKPIVPLKFGNPGKPLNHSRASTTGGSNFRGRQTKESKR